MGRALRSRAGQLPAARPRAAARARRDPQLRARQRLGRRHEQRGQRIPEVPRRTARRRGRVAGTCAYGIVARQLRLGAGRTLDVSRTLRRVAGVSQRAGGRDGQRRAPVARLPGADAAAGRDARQLRAQSHPNGGVGQAASRPRSVRRARRSLRSAGARPDWHSDGRTRRPRGARLVRRAARQHVFGLGSARRPALRARRDTRAIERHANLRGVRANQPRVARLEVVSNSSMVRRALSSNSSTPASRRRSAACRLAGQLGQATVDGRTRTTYAPASRCGRSTRCSLPPSGPKDCSSCRREPSALG